MAHRNAIMNEFNTDLDAIVIIEGDVIFDINDELFISKIYESLEFAEKEGASFITFANVLFGVGSNAPNEIKSFGDWDKIDHFLCCNCYMITKKERIEIQNKLKYPKWQEFDVWLYWNYDKRVPIFKLNKPIAYEVAGFSMINLQYKSSNYLP